MKKLTLIFYFILVVLVSGCNKSATDERFSRPHHTVVSSSDDDGQREIRITEKQLKELLSGSNTTNSTAAKVSINFAFLSWVFNILYQIVGIIIGVYIYKNAKRRQKLWGNLHPLIWAAIAIVDPALGLLAYWLIHYSKFSKASVDDDISA